MMGETLKLLFAMSPLLFAFIGYVTGYHIGYEAAETAAIVGPLP